MLNSNGMNDTKLNPNAKEFDLTQKRSTFIQLSQYEIYTNLQNVNTQIIDLKYLIENSLSASLQKLNQQIIFATDPNCFSLLQSQKLMIMQQIQSSQILYQKLQQNLNYLQMIYQQQNTMSRCWNKLNNKLNGFFKAKIKTKKEKKDSKMGYYDIDIDFIDYDIDQKWVIHGLLYDDISNFVYFLGENIVFRYDINTNEHKLFKPPQPLFGTATFAFIPHSNNKKLIVFDSSGFKNDYLYIYDIINNQIEYKTIIKLPHSSRIGVGNKYQLSICSILQSHNILSQIQFADVVNNLYNKINENKQNAILRFVPLDVIKLMAMFYYHIECNLVGNKYYVTFNISSLFYCMDGITNTKQYRNIYYNSMCSGIKYANDLKQQQCHLKITFNSKINNHRIFALHNKWLYIFGDDSYYINLYNLQHQKINMNDLSHFEFIRADNDYFIILGGNYNNKKNMYFHNMNDCYFNWKLSAICLPDNNDYIGCYDSKHKMIHIFGKHTGSHYSMSLQHIIKEMTYCNAAVIQQ